jgi:hypothetical protein
MSLGLRTNFNDPRFQRALLEERASRPYSALPVAGRATSEFVNMDLATRLQLHQLGLQSRLQDEYLRAGNFEIKMAERELRGRQRELPVQMAVGGVMGLASLLEGRRRAKLEKEDREFYKGQQRRQIDLLRAIQAAQAR